jgi:hypothetical protein
VILVDDVNPENRGVAVAPVRDVPVRDVPARDVRDVEVLPALENVCNGFLVVLGGGDNEDIPGLERAGTVFIVALDENDIDEVETLENRGIELVVGVCNVRVVKGDGVRIAVNVNDPITVVDVINDEVEVEAITEGLDVLKGPKGVVLGVTEGLTDGIQEAIADPTAAAAPSIAAISLSESPGEPRGSSPLYPGWAMLQSGEEPEMYGWPGGLYGEPRRLYGEPNAVYRGPGWI